MLSSSNSNSIATSPTPTMLSTPTPTPTPPASTASTVSPVSSSNKIRNIIQTAQEREVIKQAPDLVVMIDGASYLLNPYVYSQAGATNPYTLVHFNDHVIGFSAGYDTDQFVPSCTISLSVPNHQKNLYQAPGGENIIKTMAYLVVYTKGYWLSANGNSLYYRVFKGLIKSVSHTDNGKTLDITITGAGILYFLQLTQLELKAPVQNSAHSGTIVTNTQYANLTPYEMIATTFRDVDLQQGFQVPSSDGSPVINSVWADSINNGYISKWQAILYNIDQDVHIFGVTPTDPSSSSVLLNPLTTDPALLAGNNVFTGTVKASDQINDNIILSGIREHHPEGGVDGVSMTNSKMQTRLERLRYLTNMIGFEGYQDVNGSVIVKPPLYNLDCTQITNPTDASTIPTGASSIISQLTDSNNPFIVYLSEILSESETEDEAGILCTRMQVQGALAPGNCFTDLTTTFNKPAGEFIDIDKLARFGLREPPLKSCNWLKMGDVLGLFSVAAWELQKANKGWRTYTVTIPLRPELRLGFTMYFPHKDMYGYVKSINHSYQYGGSCTTTITLDAIRKRPMFPNPPTMVNGVNTILYSTQPNLVHEYTSDSPSAATLTLDPNLAVLAGNATSITTPKDSITNPSNDQLRLRAWKDQLKQWTGLPYDTPGNHFRIQLDTTFDAPQPADGAYLDKLIGTGATPAKLPYTNSQGYEVLAPFPWGRYTSLRKALYECCQGFSIVPMPASNGVGSLTGVQTFLFSGLGTPPNTTTAETLLSTLRDDIQSMSSRINSDAVFELTYSGDAIATADQTTTGDPLVLDLKNTIAAKAQLMVTGMTNVSAALKAATQLQRTSVASVAGNSSQTPAQISQSLAVQNLTESTLG